MLTVNDVFTDNIQHGIFFYMNILEVPWKSENNTTTLNMMYHLQHSGDKYISPFVCKQLDAYDELSEDACHAIAKALVTMYKTRWDKLWRIQKVEYNPIENYSMTELEQANNTDTTQRTGTEGRNISGQSSAEDSRSAFNKAEMQKTDSTSMTSQDTDNMTRNLTDDTATTIDRNLKRSGNIGVTTSQQMIESEIELWKFNFYNSVFEDIDKILTLKIY